MIQPIEANNLYSYVKETYQYDRKGRYRAKLKILEIYENTN